MGDDSPIKAIMERQEAPTPLRGIVPYELRTVQMPPAFFGSFGWPGTLNPEDLMKAYRESVIARMDFRARFEPTISVGTLAEGLENAAQLIVQQWRAQIQQQHQGQSIWCAKVEDLLRAMSTDFVRRMSNVTDTFHHVRQALDFIWDHSSQNTGAVQSQVAKLGTATQSFVENVYLPNNARFEEAVTNLRATVAQLFEDLRQIHEEQQKAIKITRDAILQLEASIGTEIRQLQNNQTELLQRIQRLEQQASTGSGSVPTSTLDSVQEHYEGIIMGQASIFERLDQIPGDVVSREDVIREFRRLMTEEMRPIIKEEVLKSLSLAPLQPVPRPQPPVETVVGERKAELKKEPSESHSPVPKPQLLVGAGAGEKGVGLKAEPEDFFETEELLSVLPEGVRTAEERGKGIPSNSSCAVLNVTPEVDLTTALMRALQDNSVGKERRDIVEKLRPRWSGDYNAWPTFWKRWATYWESKNASKAFGEMDKCLVFLECLPQIQRDRLWSLVQDQQWSFEKVVESLNAEVASQLPPHRLEAKWRSYIPEGGQPLQLTAWWTRWSDMLRRLQGFVTDQAAIVQFDTVINRVCPKSIEQILKAQEIRKIEINLEDRWAFVERDARIREKVVLLTPVQGSDNRRESSQQRPVRQTGRTPVRRCFICGETGHFRDECPRRRKGGKKGGRKGDDRQSRSPFRGRGRDGQSRSPSKERFFRSVSTDRTMSPAREKGHKGSPSPRGKGKGKSARRDSSESRGSAEKKGEVKGKGGRGRGVSQVQLPPRRSPFRAYGKGSVEQSRRPGYGRYGFTRQSPWGRALARRQNADACWLCGRMGHRARQCRSSFRKPPRMYARGVEAGEPDTSVEGESDFYEFIEAMSPEELEDFIQSCETGEVWEEEENEEDLEEEDFE